MSIMLLRPLFPCVAIGLLFLSSSAVASLRDGWRAPSSPLDVIGWYVGSNGNTSASFPPSALAWNFYTRVVVRMPPADDSGAIACPSPAADPLLYEVVALARAHDAGVLWVGGGEVWELINGSSSGAARRTAFLASVGAAALACGVAGIEFDFECPPTPAGRAGVVSPAEADAYTVFLADVLAALESAGGAQATVSADLGVWGLDGAWGKGSSYPLELEPWVNVTRLREHPALYVNTMSYHTPDDCSTDLWALDGAFFSDVWGIPRAQINLGIGFFSYNASAEPTWGQLAAHCPGVAPSVCHCAGVAFAGKDMVEAIGAYVQAQGFRGVFPWAADYDSLAPDDALITPLARGLGLTPRVTLQQPALSSPAPPSFPPAPPLSCSTAVDCSYAGACVAGACVCEQGFMGATCAALNNATRVPVHSGFRLDAYHVWGSQVVYDRSDGVYTMAASIYPVELPFLQSWLYVAQICTATSRTPLGPYTMGDIVLPYGAADAWDRSVMNPKLLRAPLGGPWLLFFTGSSYSGPTPGGSVPLPTNQTLAQASQRVGLATAPRPGGPYTRRGAPVLSPRPGSWESRIISNAAIAPYGGNSSALLMVYKSSSPSWGKQTRVCFGVARAEAWDAPFVRLSDAPILPCPDNSFYAEDPTLWRDTNGVFHCVFKDFAGHYTRVGYSGAHATSADGGATWMMTTPPLAYTTTHTWSDGVTRKQRAQERVQILLNETSDGGDGAPLAVFYATDTELDGSARYWNMAVPLRPSALG